MRRKAAPQTATAGLALGRRQPAIGLADRLHDRRVGEVAERRVAGAGEGDGAAVSVRCRQSIGHLDRLVGTARRFRLAGDDVAVFGTGEGERDGNRPSRPSELPSGLRSLAV